MLIPGCACIIVQPVDDVILRLKENDRCMRKEELDARNLEQRPKIYYEKTTELYNSDKVYATTSVPNLHSSFAKSRILALRICLVGP